MTNNENEQSAQDLIDAVSRDNNLMYGISMDSTDQALSDMLARQRIKNN